MSLQEGLRYLGNVSQIGGSVVWLRYCSVMPVIIKTQTRIAIDAFVISPDHML